MSKEKKICCIYLLYNKKGYGYIGKSKNLIKRLGRHRSGVKYNKGCMSRSLGEFDYEILEEVEEKDLIDFEKYYYDMYFDMFGDMLVNKNKPLRTMKEYRQHHNKQYREDHKEELKEWNKQYRQDHKEEINKRGKKFYQDHMEYYKQYRQDHKEELNKKDKKYYQDHKEEILKKQNEKINCECGGVYTKTNKIQHHKSQKHKKLLLKKRQNDYSL